MDPPDTNMIREEIETEFSETWKGRCSEGPSSHFLEGNTHLTNQLSRCEDFFRQSSRSLLALKTGEQKVV